jgi:hypothetical protein
MPFKSPAVPPPKIEVFRYPSAEPQFVAHHETIRRGGQIVGRMISKTLAKRAANALNRHQPNSEGV